MRWQFSLYFSIFCFIFVKAKSIPDSTEEQQKQNRIDYERLPKDNEYNDMLVGLPLSFDWRTEGGGAVTEVKDQNKDECSEADWAFAAVGALEGQLSINDKTKVNLSAQELIDCSTNGGNYGCGGGDVKKAFNYITANGISTQEKYPYIGKNGNCIKLEDNQKVAKHATIELEPIPYGSEQEMKQKLKSEGPILAIIDGSQDSFLEYKGGIYQDGNCAKIGKHNVLIVGYGETDADPKEEFWIVKNSWGEEWGEKGYIRIARGKNTCGIATNATYIEYSK
ncbi:procathepsin L-like isoform X2 [Planococcus citri]|uniref:procathepsin L-like isoform X2 n=1 Tax=Planococcus citri TaxID=170843 RepID=UPI0031F9F6BD